MSAYSVEQLANGYWAATIRLPSPDGGPDYTQSADAFHDEQEARDWAQFMVGFFTPGPDEVEGCEHDWELYEDEGARPYTGYLERCKRCGLIVQVPA